MDLRDHAKHRDRLLPQSAPDETLEELAAALESLPADLADIIVYRYYDCKPLTVIAEMLGISYGATKLRHNKALALLRSALG